MANHVLMFPFYTQGHLTPMMHLAELLSNHNIRITFINNNFYNFPVHTPRSLEHYSRLPNFRFLSLNTPHQPPHKSFPELIGQEEARKVSCRDEYKRVLGPVDGWPKVTCVVADGFVSLALDVPEELGIPIIISHTTNAASVWFYYCIPTFLESNDFPFDFEDELEYEKEVNGVPGMEGILRRRDLPNFMMEANDQVIQYIATTGKNLCRAEAVIFNTVEAVESPILSHIRSIVPTTYTVGPIHKLLDHHQIKHGSICDQDEEIDDDDDRTCLTWLDSQPVGSVVYVSFGSTTRMSKEQLMELWHGLADSGYPFLWVVRKDLLVGSEEDSMVKNVDVEDAELMDATKERGCIVGWAPQKEVLRHPSVGSFLTHSGWNSILESIDAGVPMICWSFMAEQPMNRRFAVHVWNIGVDVEMNRRGVEKALKKVMDGDGALETRRKVALLRKLSEESVDGGSSFINFKALVQHILSFTA